MAFELINKGGPDGSKVGSTIFLYNQEQHTPELVQEIWQDAFDLWTTQARQRGEIISGIEVPKLEVSVGLLEKPIPDVKGNLISTMSLLYPKELMGTEGLVYLGKIFPTLKHKSLLETKNSDIRNMNDQPGWLNVEATVNSPNLFADEDELENHFTSLDRTGMWENVYILLSEFIKLTTSKFIDIKTESRLLGSRDYGISALRGHFKPDGRLLLNSLLLPRDRQKYIGGRSVGLLQTI